MEMSVREARAQFAAALSAAERGERVTITKHGKPIAEIGPPTVLPKKKWDWEELDRLQEELGIPKPTAAQLKRQEQWFQDRNWSSELFGWSE
jgi:prevent-host-death family protein